MELIGITIWSDFLWVVCGAAAPVFPMQKLAYAADHLLLKSVLGKL
jgi:hypothetical protein